MKNKDFEKYISELSPELQEKARQCKDAEELNRLLAENDVELSETALEAVAGGCSCSSRTKTQGDAIERLKCPECGGVMYYWDQTSSVDNRYYCGNGACKACQGNWLYAEEFEYDGRYIKYKGILYRVK